MATYSNIVAWKIPLTEESGGCSPWGLKESDMTEHRAHAEASLTLSLLFIRLCAHVLYCRQDGCWGMWDAAFTPLGAERGRASLFGWGPHLPDHLTARPWLC